MKFTIEVRDFNHHLFIYLNLMSDAGTHIWYGKIIHAVGEKGESGQMNEYGRQLLKLEVKLKECNIMGKSGGFSPGLAMGNSLLQRDTARKER